ncbi:hypothetical protein AYO40_00385 [Planctomycetaceae bacterium SCGC AG-212-D15]|nr:hypothetical protein AYO40_00385 [Planctomycetaceae bacterium SCGC AG-212-D15]
MSINHDNIMFAVEAGIIDPVTAAKLLKAIRSEPQRSDPTDESQHRSDNERRQSAYLCHPRHGPHPVRVFMSPLGKAAAKEIAHATLAWVPFPRNNVGF